ncbi:hypothetical protein BcepSauron_417 [Burkholderia phage BcepSauron]|uniref:Uncharacterized protein n=1 Tax=Burkholderia phage BcepSauron TaxID=2530033 RepID=A0A482ML99_9CAUD|nr:hypothetical protein H1O17_gp417 [Burkholderia phage BcepSauron]QBQ74797.1 hypothetical protein BcepSauron_417 [Burkholderia phage BcepSauron]
MAENFEQWWERYHREVLQVRGYILPADLQAAWDAALGVGPNKEPVKDQGVIVTPNPKFTVLENGKYYMTVFPFYDVEYPNVANRVEVAEFVKTVVRGVLCYNCPNKRAETFYIGLSDDLYTDLGYTDEAYQMVKKHLESLFAVDLEDFMGFHRVYEIAELMIDLYWDLINKVCGGSGAN